MTTEDNPERVNVLIDCDPGHDDAAALVVARRFANILGITTVGGNAPLADVTQNALMTCQLFDIDVEVHAGACRPLVAEPLHAPEIHGVNGFAGPSLPELTKSVASNDAVAYLIEQIRANEGIWLIVLGPMTNIALALRSAPDIADKLAGISFMGGSAGAGNSSPVSEFNVMVDPEAAHIVLSSGIPLKMAGLDLTNNFVIDDELVSKVRNVGNRGAAVIGDLMGNYLDSVEKLRGRRQGGLHDPCAVLAVTHPWLIKHTDRQVAVECAGTLTRGMTVVDQRVNAGPPNVAHGHTLDVDAATEALLDALAVHGAAAG